MVLGVVLCVVVLGTIYFFLKSSAGWGGKSSVNQYPSAKEKEAALKTLDSGGPGFDPDSAAPTEEEKARALRSLDETQ